MYKVFPFIPILEFDGDWLASTTASDGWNGFFQVIRFGIPSVCFFYMLFLVIVPLTRTDALNSFFAISPIVSRPPLYDDAPFYKRMYGPLRDGIERQELEGRCSSVIFRHTIARKHPYVLCLYLVTGFERVLSSSNLLHSESFVACLLCTHSSGLSHTACRFWQKL